MTAPASTPSDPADQPRTRRGALRPVADLPGGDLSAAPVWWARLAHRGTRPVEHSLVAVASGRCPHGSAVDLASVDPRGGRPAGWLVDVRYRATDGTVVGLHGAPGLAVPGLRLWLAEVAHAASDLPSTSLVAFRGDAFPPGALVSPREVAARGLGMADSVAGLRWWTRSGLVETVSVASELSGRGVPRLLTALAGGLAKLRGWPSLVESVDWSRGR